MVPNIFSYIGKSIFYISLGYAGPDLIQGIGNFLEVTFRRGVVFGFQLFCVIMVLAQLVKLATYILGEAERK